MKKLFTTLMILAIAASSFAQVQFERPIDVEKQLPFKESNSFIKDRIPPSLSNQKAAGPYWFNYIAVALKYYGIEVTAATRGGAPVLYDGKALYEYSNATAPVQFYSIAQAFDFGDPNYDYWNDMLVLEMGLAPSIASLPEGSTYSIDSVELWFRYDKGTNVSDDVVDTLLISYAINCDMDRKYSLINEQEEPLMAIYAPRYDSITHGFADAATENAIAGSESVKIVYSQKVPLTIADTTNGFSVWQILPADPRLQNISGKVVMAGVTFIPGNDIVRDTINTVMGTDINIFSVLNYSEFRAGYNDYGSEILKLDRNTSMYISENNYYYNPDNKNWYQQWAPTKFWNNHPRPWIGLKINCPDCSAVSINEPTPAKKSISVYPNPANTIVNIELNNDSKAQVELYSLVGQLVYREETNTQKVTLNVSGMPNGVYMLKVTQNGTVYTSKVVVK